MFRLALLCTLLLAADEPTDVVVSGESRTSTARLVEARKMFDAKKWKEATIALVALSESSTELAALPDGRYVQARLEAQRLLARLPAKALEDHRRRAEPQAKRWLQQGLDEDPAMLRRVADEAFCTRAALTAIDRLGDLAFERGRFDEAELWWATLAPLRPGDGDQLVYPDAPADVAARVKAKQLLARLFAGRAGFDADVAAYRKAHPKAAGKLAGHDGTYADVIDKVVKERAARPAETAGDWLTFAGSSSRQAVVPATDKLLDQLSSLARGGPAWRFDLEARKAIDDDLALPDKQKAIDAARRQAFHPAVVGDRALIGDARYVTAFDLKTGKAAMLFDVVDHVKNAKVLTSLPAVPDQRHSLTVADDVVYARLGCPWVKDVRPHPRTQRIPDGADSVLVALSPAGAKHWMVKAIDASRKEYAVFEGAPVAGRGRVWIAASRFEGDKLITAVHCYPGTTDEAEPAPLWRADVCQTRELLPAGGDDVKFQRRYRLHQLTLAGTNVLYCSHSGVIVALDAATGRQSWALRYKRRDLREPEDEPALRDLSPCLFVDGRVYAAPADSESLFCLDPITGEILWERERLDVVSMLGVGKGRLIFSTHKNARQGVALAGGLRAVNADDGSDDGGWELPDDGGGLTPMGRGLLVGDLVLWPTGRTPCGVVAVRQEDGRQPDNPSLLHRVPSGNLVFANGRLLVCGQRMMWAFVPPETVDDDKVSADLVLPRLRLARAAAAKRQWATAIERYDDVLKIADAADRFLREARRERQQAMLDAADEAMRAKKVDEARRWLTSALQGATGRARLDALVRQAQLWERAGERAEAARAWKAVAAEGGVVEDDQGLPQRAAWAARRRLQALGEKQETKAKVNRAASTLKAMTLPLHPTLTLTLPAGERYLPASVTRDALYSFSDKGDLYCRNVEGEIRWRSPLPFAPTWLADLGECVVAAGPDAIACLDAAGERLWHLPAPDERLFPWSSSPDVRVPRDVRPGGELSRFLLVGERLVFVQGGHTLFGVDVGSGEVLWKRQPIDAGLSLPAPCGMVHHVVPFGDDTLLTQVSGRRWLMSASTGQLLAETRDAVAPWPRAPHLLADGALIVVDSRRVERIEAKSLKVRWTFAPKGKTTRSGGPPLALGDVVVVPENLGLRIVRLSADKGGEVWSKRVDGDPDRLAARHWARGEHLYAAEGDTLSAWSLADGKLVWTRRLLGGRSWRISLSGKTLLAWPASTKALAVRFRRGDASYQASVGPWPDADGVLPLWCLDAADGEPLARLNLPADVPDARVTRRANRGGLFPALEAGFADDYGPALRVGGRFMFGIGRSVRVWDGGR